MVVRNLFYSESSQADAATWSTAIPHAGDTGAAATTPGIFDLIVPMSTDVTWVWRTRTPSAG